jgi:hypothetical protein
VRNLGPTIPRHLLELIEDGEREEIFLLFADCQGKVRGVIRIGQQGRDDLQGHSFDATKVVMTALASEHLNSGIKCVGFIKRGYDRNMSQCACHDNLMLTR